MIKKTIKLTVTLQQHQMASFSKYLGFTLKILLFLSSIKDLLFSFNMECSLHLKLLHSMDPTDSSINFQMTDMMFGWETLEEIFTVE
jgi:hypothetical protein